jgi:cell division protein YceG involved in septum cleavage
MCVQKAILATLTSFIIFLELLLFLKTCACIVYSFFSEKQQACHPKVQVLITLREGRKVDVMLTHLKEGQEAVILIDNTRRL